MLTVCFPFPILWLHLFLNKKISTKKHAYSNYSALFSTDPDTVIIIITPIGYSETYITFVTAFKALIVGIAVASVINAICRLCPLNDVYSTIHIQKFSFIDMKWLWCNVQYNSCLEIVSGSEITYHSHRKFLNIQHQFCRETYIEW